MRCRLAQLIIVFGSFGDPLVFIDIPPSENGILSQNLQFPDDVPAQSVSIISDEVRFADVENDD